MFDILLLGVHELSVRNTRHAFWCKAYNDNRPRFQRYNVNHNFSSSLSTDPSRWGRLFSSIDFAGVPNQHSRPQLQGFHAVLPGHICRTRRMIRRPIYHAQGVIQGTCDKGQVSGPLGASARAHGRARFVSTSSLSRCFSRNCSVGPAFIHVVRFASSKPGPVLGPPTGKLSVHPAQRMFLSRDPTLCLRGWGELYKISSPQPMLQWFLVACVRSIISDA